MSINIEKILTSNPEVTDYKIRTEKTESYQLFFVHEKLETVRSTDTDATTVTVYVDHDEKKGHSGFNLYASTSESEAAEKIKNAVERAKNISNEYYSLPENETLDGEIASNFTDYEPYALAKKVADAVYAADTYGNGSINALEVFINKKTVTVKNSRGIDKKEVKYTAMAEAIPTWTDGESVELYECKTFSSFDSADITSEIEEKMRQVRDRGRATPPAEQLKCPVVLDAQELATLIGDIAFGLDYSAVYTKSNPYSIGDAIQKEPTGDKLTVTMKGAVEGSVSSALFDENGTTLINAEVIKDGVVTDYFGNHRFAEYLGKKATGNLRCMEVGAGTLTYEELAAKPYFRCVSMSGLQVDIFNDYIGGEVSLGYYWDGENNVPVTGISISGKLSEALASVRFSDSITVADNYRGPKFAYMNGIEIV